MEDASINLHHLMYFKCLVDEGSVSGAASRLGRQQPTVSAQVRQLQETLGHKLYSFRKRSLMLTPEGKRVYHYAKKIHSLSRELGDSLRDGALLEPGRLTVGIADIVPKQVAYWLLRPVLTGNMRVVCLEEKAGILERMLEQEELDIAISDSPLPRAFDSKMFSSRLATSEVTIFGAPKRVRELEGEFPASLVDAPLLLPTPNTGLRQRLDVWLDEHSVQPRVQGEFADSALLYVFGQEGRGFFPGPEIIATEITERFQVAPVGTTGVRVEFYANGLMRELQHPGVAAILGVAQGVK
ncbi:MAG: LysR family transcriptional regulator [bacterium]|nr:LysR family transcriptional regulator [bacterium]